MSTGAIHALDLSSDMKVALIILILISGILEVKEPMYRRKCRKEWESQAAGKEATIAINKLKTHLVGMRIFGHRNSQILACARNRETHSPTISCLPMNTE